MSQRLTVLALLALATAGCATGGGGGEDSYFAVIDTNDDGQVDIEEFRSQTLFPAYEQFFYEANEDDNDTLGPEEFGVAQSQVYNAMGVGGVDI